MLLKSISLENIRSYVYEKIDFSSGTTLLSGDIGSGKSTILLAIEFALFGTSRPNLQASSLLRKGSQIGSVNLKFELNNQEIIIKRTLKKEKDTIKQLSGHIIINNSKKELTPLELKAKIINILGYPKEYITKNKNYIFRYTIYTPQEEMKLILQESCEIRLNVLRKIFNVDKYKIIRENTQLFLRDLKINISVLKTSTQNLSEKKQEFNQIQKECNILKESINKNKNQLIELQNKLNKKKQELNILEIKNEEFKITDHKIKTLKALLDQKYNELNKTKEKIITLQDKLISKNKSYLTKDQAKIALNQIQDKKNLFVKEQTILIERKKSIEKSILETNEEIEQISKILSNKSQIIEKINSHNEKFNQKEEHEKKLLEKKDYLDTLKKHIIEQKASINHSISLKERVCSIDTCPTCKQPVDSEYKKKITNNEDKKIQNSKIFLNEFEEKEQKLLIEIKQIEKTLKQTQQIEKELIELESKLKQIIENEEKFNQKYEKLKNFHQEIKSIIDPKTYDERILKLENKIKQIQDQLNELSKNEEQEKQLKQLKEEELEQLEEIKLKKSEYELKLNKLNTLENKNEQIIKEKKELDNLLEKEKDFLLIQTEQKTKLKHLNEFNQKLDIEIKELSKKYNDYIKFQELTHWLEEYFISLTYTIEKHLMIIIHRHFNELFQEWFNILVEDTNMYARLDDSFTPIIEQNGYEINFNDLSGGEKTSASLAYRLALNRVINDVIHQINTKELLILDEPTDGFSSEQLNKVRDVLEKLNCKQTLIVSHEAKIESFVQNIIKINKIENQSIPS